jgi:hypothetical protein
MHFLSLAFFAALREGTSPAIVLCARLKKNESIGGGNSEVLGAQGTCIVTSSTALCTQ